MSHLKEQISALVDGELTGAELDRANGHLAACGRCRAEAAELRELKRELRALASGQGAVRDDDAFTRRLLALAGPGGPVPSRRFRRDQFRRKRGDQRGGRPGGRPGGGTGPRTSRQHPHADAHPYYWQQPQAPRRRGRYVVWGAVSLVVVGIGAAAFSMGGATADPGPKITPQQEIQMFYFEHAMNSGDVPYPDPTQAPTARP